MATIKSYNEFNKDLSEVKDNLIYSIVNQIKRFGEDFDVDNERFSGMAILINEIPTEYEFGYSMPTLLEMRVLRITEDGMLYV